MPDALEDPRKTELRERVAASLDGAGFDLDELRTPIPYPADTNLRGGIKGDVVCRDSQRTTHVYFVRLDSTKPIPGWLTNYVVASHTMADVQIHVAVVDVTAQLRASCTAVGAGLVRICDDNTLERELEYARPDEAEALKRFTVRSKAARRRLQNKVDLNLDALKRRFDETSTEMAGMSDTVRDKYLVAIEETALKWQEWVDSMSTRLDEITTDRDAEGLEQFERDIADGPDL